MPQNAEYLMLGLAAIGTIMGIYLLSLMVRFASVRRALTRTKRYSED